MSFISSQGEVMVSDVQQRVNLLKTSYSTKMDCHRLNFKLKTSRPKAGISLPKKLFGIPEEADIYLFVENHTSVPFMTEAETEDMLLCCTEFGEHADPEIRALQVFLKIFFEGGFAYNKKIPVKDGFVPQNLSIACLGMKPQFDGQAGISTGYPYELKSAFLPFSDTVPVTIPAIAQMSDRHSRYGLCFTRCVHIWEAEEFQKDGVLDYCSVIPHGGFYYVPGSLEEHQKVGGLVYAFGEKTDAPGQEANQG